MEGNRNRNGVEIETQEESDHAETDIGDYDDGNHSNRHDTSAMGSASVTDTTHQDTNDIEDYDNDPPPSSEPSSIVDPSH